MLPATNANDLTVWLVNFAAVAAIVLVAARLIDLFRRKPPLEKELEALLDKVRLDINELRLDTARQLAEVRAQIDGAHTRVDTLTRDINDKLQRLPSDIVNLLHKTGAIHKNTD